jgi:hypothetical protein
MRVYLSGPMTGLTPGEAQEWRSHTMKRLLTEGGDSFEVHDPFRGTAKLHPRRRQIVCKRPTQEIPELSDKAFVLRDYFDTLNCEITFCNLLGAKRVSIGSVAEVVAASHAKRLVIIVMEKKGNIHDHPFVREAGIIFHTLDRAIDYTLSCAGEGPESEEDGHA